jgi:serine/threonine protein kinase
MTPGDALTGTRVGPYRLDRPIARGGMGVVYRAEHVRLERVAAVKLISPELASDTSYQLRFEREARAVAALDHPNVLTVYDYGESEGRPYIAMRYVDGPDLSRVLAAEGRLAPERAARIVAQAAAGLDAAHARGMVHRDVKPANLLIERQGATEHVFVTDFGLIRAASAGQTSLTREGGFVGTLDYVAPEQISEEAIDGRVDVYGLGCVLYQSLTGDLPYPRDTGVAKMHAHLHDPPPQFADAQLAARFGAIVARAMAKRPQDRYASAGELGRAALEAAGSDATRSGIAFPRDVDASRATEVLPTRPLPPEPEATVPFPGPTAPQPGPVRPFTPPPTPSVAPRAAGPSLGKVALAVFLLLVIALLAGLALAARDVLSDSLTTHDGKRFALYAAIAGAVAAPISFAYARVRGASGGAAAGWALGGFVVVGGAALLLLGSAIALDCVTEDLACRR